jgi:hypothetical protein
MEKTWQKEALALKHLRYGEAVDPHLTVSEQRTPHRVGQLQPTTTSSSPTSPSSDNSVEMAQERSGIVVGLNKGHVRIPLPHCCFLLQIVWDLDGTESFQDWNSPGRKSNQAGPS